MTVQLDLVDIRKSYGHVDALKAVSISCHGGQVVGLLGDNGAGKSTLVKILSGSIRPTAGQILVNETAVEMSEPSDARLIGIETVYQHLALCHNLDVTANLFLNREIRHRNRLLARLGWMDQGRMRSESAEILGRLHIRMPSVRQRVSSLSGGQQQAVAVGRAVGWGNMIVLMDEPAAALGVEQTAIVLQIMKELRNSGVLVIFITHNMSEVMDVCDRAIVLRHGQVVADVEVASVTARELVQYITGAA